MGWSGLFEPGRSSGVYGGQKLAATPTAGTARSKPAQQPRIEVDVFNLGSSRDLTIFPPLAFMGITPNLTFSTEIF